MLPLVAMYENQVIPKGIKHISSIKQEKPSKVINNQHNLQTQTNTINHQTFQIKLIKQSFFTH